MATLTLGETLAALSRDPDYVNLRELPHVRIDLKYATADNFMGRDVYGEFREAFLHRESAEKLRRAIELLGKERPGATLLILDALRPRSVQRVLWDHVKDTPNQAYVANPDRGSMHNYGCAIDLTVLDEQGRELDMGTPFDTFDALSEPRLEEEHLRMGALARAQVDHRLLLRRAMTGAGFIPLTHEWWHFNSFPDAEVRQRFRIIE